MTANPRIHRRGGALAACRAHNPGGVGSNPTPGLHTGKGLEPAPDWTRRCGVFRAPAPDCARVSPLKNRGQQARRANHAAARKPPAPSGCFVAVCPRTVYTVRRHLRNRSWSPPHAHPATPLPNHPTRPPQHAPDRANSGRAAPQEFFPKNSYVREGPRSRPPAELNS